MPKLFSSPDDTNLTATDYISRKRNLVLYCDYGNENNGRKIAKNYMNGQLQNAVNHSSLLNLTKGYYDYNQRLYVNDNLFQTYVGEKYIDRSCKRTAPDSSTLSTNYTGILLVNESNDNQIIEDTLFDNVVNYNEMETKTINNVEKDERIHKTKCFQFPLSKLMKKE